MPFVIYVAPHFSEFSVRILVALADLPDVQLAVINQAPEAVLDPQVRSKIIGHWRVENVQDSSQLAWAAGELAQWYGPIDRLFSALEFLQISTAEARERLGVPGMSVAAARNFRDKARMKDVLRAAGVPCARHRLVTTDAEARQFAA